MIIIINNNDNSYFILNYILNIRTNYNVTILSIKIIFNLLN